MGRRVGLEDMKPIDLIVCGSVAVDRRGGRIGKGGGYSDLEFAVATTAGKVGPGTAIITTVHPLQIIAGELPMHRHDIPLDVIVTPAEIIRCRRQPRPTGVYWDWLPEEKVAAIPVLQRMAPRRTAFTYVGLDPDWNVYRA
jgi:5-formyltetrahydrofolate cyclo-ligase